MRGLLWLIALQKIKWFSETDQEGPIGSLMSRWPLPVIPGDMRKYGHIGHHIYRYMTGTEINTFQQIPEWLPYVTVHDPLCKNTSHAGCRYKKVDPPQLFVFLSRPFMWDRKKNANSHPCEIKDLRWNAHEGDGEAWVLQAAVTGIETRRWRRRGSWRRQYNGSVCRLRAIYEVSQIVHYIGPAFLQ